MNKQTKWPVTTFVTGGHTVYHLRPGRVRPGGPRRFFSMAMMDVNHDGREEILLSGSWGEHGRIYAYGYDGSLLFSACDPRIPDVPYRMNILVPVSLDNDAFIIGQFANILIVYNLDGSCREVVTGPFAYTNATYDRESQTLLCGSSVSGGDEIVAIHLNQKGWQQAFQRFNLRENLLGSYQIWRC